eukprot:m51a1_g5811 putative protein kinase domain containing protein (981) ;mRNA; r:146240-149867
MRPRLWALWAALLAAARGAPGEGLSVVCTGSADSAAPVTTPLVFNGSAVRGYALDSPAALTRKPLSLVSDTLRFKWYSSAAYNVSYAFSSDVGILETYELMQSASWGLLESSARNVSLAPAGLVPTAARPAYFTLHLECPFRSGFLALVTLLFALRRSDDPLAPLSAVGVAFAWNCTPLTCDPACVHGVCRRGSCVCHAGFMGSRCQNLLSLGPRRPCPAGVAGCPEGAVVALLCPGEGLRLNYSLPATGRPRTEWLMLDGLLPGGGADYRQWFYVATGRTRPPDVASGWNATLAGSRTWLTPSMMSPGPHTLSFFGSADVFSLAYTETFFVLPWAACGAGNVTQQRCERGRFWWNCTRGCSPSSPPTLTARSGVVRSDENAPPGWPTTYDLGMNCTWIIAPETREGDAAFVGIELRILAFSVDDKDLFAVYRPVAPPASPLFTEMNNGSMFLQSRMDTPFRVDGRVVYVMLVSGDAVSASGFVLNYTVVLGDASASAPVVAYTLPVALVVVAVPLIALAAWWGLKLRRAKLHALTLLPPEVMGAQEYAELLELSPTRAAEALERSLSVQVSASLLTFGVPAESTYLVGREYSETVVLANRSPRRRSFCVHVPGDTERLVWSCAPARGVLPSFGTAQLRVSVTLRLTTSLATGRAKIVVGGRAPAVLEVRLNSAASDRIDPEEIELEPPALASGAFGSVYRGRYRGRPVAVKILRANHQEDERVLARFRKEIEVYNTLRHPMICEFIGASHISGKLCLCTELFAFGSVAALIRSGAPLAYALRLKFVQNIAEAMAFLHSNGVIHRDLKPSNVLISSFDLGDKVNCKLTDFGCSRTVKDINELFRYTIGVGTPAYLAPELLEGHEYSAAVDVYAFGVTMWSIAAQADPWAEAVVWDIPALVAAGRRPTVPPSCPAAYREIMERCWAQSPADRPLFASVSGSVTELAFKELAVLPMTSMHSATAAMTSPRGNSFDHKFDSCL